jgi:hypothetical protein
MDEMSSTRLRLDHTAGRGGLDINGRFRSSSRGIAGKLIGTTSRWLVPTVAMMSPMSRRRREVRNV